MDKLILVAAFLLITLIGWLGIVEGITAFLVVWFGIQLVGLVYIGWHMCHIDEETNKILADLDEELDGYR